MGKYWFKAKDYGWGTGFPVAWQGWVALLGLLLLIMASGFVDGIFIKTVPLKSWLRYFIDVIIITVLFLIIFENKIEGGLGWRWGKDKK
jgi:hypothetical protein